ncbi:MAG: RNA polymerase factor sigma-70 [Planctomycetota bacterium]|nr:MAG: RNA polymerase factor sigma-70 [Planctomycetota bacterium]
MSSSHSGAASAYGDRTADGDLQRGVVEQLLRSARNDDDGDAIGRLLELYRNYLTVLATTQFDRRLRQRVSPSDLVQDALLAAHRDFRQFNGDSERQFLAWLRQILIHCLHHAIDMHVKAKRRDVRCEVSIDQAATALDRSAMNLAEMLPDRAPSPSAPLRARERAVTVANRLAGLRPAYREVIIMRNLQGLSFDEIAQRMDRNSGAVRMLWLRAVEKLKHAAAPEE